MLERTRDRYPPVLSGALYPEGIPIRPEEELPEIVRRHAVDEVVFAYSDVSLNELENVQERVRAAGAAFSTFDATAGLLPATLPCVAVCAVRTGCDKSGVARHLSADLRRRGHRVGVIRHPMPYGQLERQVVQRFETPDDLARTNARSRRWRSTSRTWWRGARCTPAPTTRRSWESPRRSPT